MGGWETIPCVILTLNKLSYLSYLVTTCTSTFSVRRSKITLEEPLEDLKSENTETKWQKLHGHAIVAGERLQEINKSVTCCFCQESIELVEILQTWFQLDVPVQ